MHTVVNIDDQAGADPAAGRWRFGSSSIGLAVVAAVAILWTFSDGLRELLHLWETKEEYSHAYLLPALSLFLFWQKKHELTSNPWTGSWSAVVVVVLGLVLFFVGTLSAIYAIIQYSLFITLAGLLLSFAGLRNLRYLWAGLILLFFTVPFPQFLYQALSTKLQLISSELGVAVIRSLGVSVFLEGNVIDLGTFKLQVIEACNGLRYLFPLASFGFLCAYLYRGPIWHKVVIFLSTIPITVFMNSLRIGIIGYTVDRWGQDMAEGLLHDFEGWAIFMACLGVLFVEIALLSRLQRPRQSFSDTFFVEIPATLPRGDVAHVQVPPPTFLTAMLVLIVSAALAGVVSERKEFIPTRLDFARFPLQLGEWQGRPQALEQMYIDALKFTDYLMVNYQRKGLQGGINLYVAYYESQRAGESAHSPRSCIPGGGWKIEGLTQVELPGLGPRGGELRANRVQIAMGDSRQLVYYWFLQRGRVITNEYLVKWYLMWDSLTRDRTDGALVRVTMAIPTGKDWRDGDAILQEFLTTLGGGLTDYVPN